MQPTVTTDCTMLVIESDGGYHTINNKVDLICLYSVYMVFCRYCLCWLTACEASQGDLFLVKAV